MKILVVEDEHKIANSIKKGFVQENYTVDVAYSGNDGLDMAMTGDFDVIVLDRMLPEIEGLLIVKRLREEKVHTPILILTAKGQTTDKVSGLDAGADDYLVKPFAFTELLSRVRALSRRPKSAIETTLRVGDLSLNTLKFEAKRAEREISLSSKEFALLEYLMRHPGQTIKKDQIINQVWSYDSGILPNSVEVYIKHLRDKIDKGEDKKLIHTIRGFGYKIGEKLHV